MEKMAQLDMPDRMYNWIRDFFSGHSHCTKLGGEASSFLDVTASIIQGSGFGPASYTVNAGCDKENCSSRAWNEQWMWQWWKLFWYRGMDRYSEADGYGNSKIWRQMRSGHKEGSVHQI